MKKTKQKLALSTETVRAMLSNEQLQQVPGGASTVATLCNCLTNIATRPGGGCQ